MRRLIYLSLLALPFVGTAQSFDQKHVKATYVGTFDPSAEQGVISQIYSTAAPSPDGESYKSYLMEVKKSQNWREFPQSTQALKTSGTVAPSMGIRESIYRYTPTGMPFPVTAGIPNDNAMAISKDGILVAAINSNFWAYDIHKEELALPTVTGLYSLQQIASGSVTENYYDPKLIYDPTVDRFVLVFLKDNDAANSKIIVCFSSSSDPADPWYVYRLDGNPLNNNRWTDFPAIALSETGLVITGNLIIPGVSWQVGFDGSVIWHLDKTAGFAGGDVGATVYTQIKHKGKLVRNLHPIRGHDNISDRLQFLSNRNFDDQNDTIFFVTLEEGTTDTTIQVDALVSNLPYGVPPNGKQADTDLTDPTSGLQTNDGRVLGAIQKDDWIQFVSTTAHGNGPTAGIYHGFIDLSGSAPKVTARVFWDDERDYGYPNIAWTGVHTSQTQCLIGFNFTSVQDNPGVGAVQLGNDTTFSDPIDIINGTCYVDRHSDGYERWGDYFAIQPMFDQSGNIVPSEIWLSGYYGDGPNQNRTVVAQVFGNDTTVTLHADGGKVYPVPAADGTMVHVEFNLDRDQFVQGHLYFSNGQYVQALAGKNIPAGPAEIMVDLASLAQGTYILKLVGDSGFDKVVKLVKH